MKNYLKRYEIELKVLGPVHIGSGEEIKKSEWIMDHGSVLVMDPRKLMQELEQIHMLDQYVNDVVYERFSLWNWAKKQNVSMSVFHDSAAYELDAAGVTRDDLNRRNIQAFIKDPYQKPYIPGSSLKGAVRNILLGMMIEQKEYDVNNIKRTIDKFQGTRSKFLKQESETLEVSMFHPKISDGTEVTDAVNDAMRGIRFSDSRPIPLDMLTLAQKVDVHTDGSDRNMPLVRETLKPGTEVTFGMTIDQTETDISGDDILRAIDGFYTDYQTMFLKQFRYRDADEELSLQGEHILFLGGGVGYPSKTVMNQLLRGDPERVCYVSRAIQTALTGGYETRDRTKEHRQDIGLGVSPRVVKMTEFDGQLLQMGACNLKMREL